MKEKNQLNDSFTSAKTHELFVKDLESFIALIINNVYCCNGKTVVRADKKNRGNILSTHSS